MNAEVPGGEQPLISHLLELRDRIIRIAMGWVLCFIPLAIFAKDVFGIAAKPIKALMPSGAAMIATQVISPFFVPLKLAMVLAVAVSMPWTLWQIWAFVAPGLYKKEQRFAAPLMVSSTLLFYAGVAGAYFFVLPALFKVMFAMSPDGVTFMPDINEYLNTVMALSLAFGLAAELPVAVVLLVATGFVTPAQLREQRGYVTVGIFIAAAVFTPPDPMSMLTLAIPMLGLYEIGIIAAQMLAARPAAAGAQDKPDAPAKS